MSLLTIHAVNQATNARGIEVRKDIFQSIIPPRNDTFQVNQQEYCHACCKHGYKIRQIEKVHFVKNNFQKIKINFSFQLDLTQCNKWLPVESRLTNLNLLGFFFFSSRKITV